MNPGAICAMEAKNIRFVTNRIVLFLNFTGKFYSSRKIIIIIIIIIITSLYCNCRQTLQQIHIISATHLERC